MSAPAPCPSNDTRVECEYYQQDSQQEGLSLWAWLAIGIGIFVVIAIASGVAVYLGRHRCTEIRRRKLHAESAVSSLAGDLRPGTPGPPPPPQQQLTNSGASFDSLTNAETADQDWFLHSLESAVFAPAASASAAAAAAAAHAAATTTGDCRLCVLNPASLPSYYGR